MKPSQPVLHYVDPADVSLEDIQWLMRAETSSPKFEQFTPEEIINSVRAGKMRLFRFVPGPGALLVRVEKSNGVRRLCLLKAAGSGTGWTFPKLAELLRATAREWGCEGVVTHVYGSQERLARAMMKVGARIESITLFLES